MYSFIAIADVAQFVGVETIIGGDFIDVLVASILIGYGLKRKLFTMQKALILAATFAGEAIPLVNAAPFWTFDLHNLYKGTSTEDVPLVDPEGPANQNGVRMPNRIQEPSNQNGVRLPNKV